MSFSEYLPSIVALVGIPVAAGLAWWRENHLRARQEERDDRLRKEQNAREDQRDKDRHAESITQRWWDRKADAYTRIVQGLWRVVDENRSEYEKEIGERERCRTLTDEEQRQMRQERDELRQAADVGALVISEEAAIALKQYFETTGKIVYRGDFLNVVEKHWEAAEACLETIRRCAIEDLQIRREDMPTRKSGQASQSSPSRQQNSNGPDFVEVNR